MGVGGELFIYEHTAIFMLKIAFLKQLLVYIFLSIMCSVCLWFPEDVHKKPYYKVITSVPLFIATLLIFTAIGAFE